MGDEKMIAEWRFQKLREAITLALPKAADLIRNLEEPTWLGEAESYHTTVELLRLLANGLSEGTVP